MAADTYVPGVCNIGSTEIANRRSLAMKFGVLTVLIAVGLLALNVAWWMALAATFPAFVAATSAIQAASHFCAGYGAVGQYNFTTTRSTVEGEGTAEQKRIDRQRAGRITLQAGLIAVVVTAALAAALYAI